MKEKQLCTICGKRFKRLSSHIRAHKNGGNPKELADKSLATYRQGYRDGWKDRSEQN